MSPHQQPTITVTFRLWAMPLFLSSLKVITALHFLGLLSDDQALQTAESLGEWTVAHGVRVG